MRRALPICLLLLLCSPAACGRNGKRHTDWVEIRTPHFRILTDGSVERGSAVGAQLECSNEILSAKFVTDGNQPAPPLYVVAFRNASEMRQVAPLGEGEAVRLGGLFLDTGSGRFIGIDLSTQNLNHIVAHEYSHSLVSSAGGQRLPLWLQEGLAEVFAASVTGESEIFESGPPAKKIPAMQLLGFREDSHEYKEQAFHGAFYSQASLTAEYLWMDQEHKNRLLTYLELTRGGKPIEVAVQQAFQKSGAELNRAVAEFASQRRRARPAAKGSCTKVAGEIVPVSDLDAQARVAEFESQTAEHLDDAIHKLESILSENPKNEIALRGLAYGLWRRGDLKQASESFARAADANPTDANLLYLSAALDTDGAHDQPAKRQRMQTALLKAISLNPDFADAHHWLSLTYAWDGDYLAASNEGKRAVDLDPENQQFKFNLAAFYAHSQRWSEARGLCEGLAAATDKDVATQAKALLQSIEQANTARETNDISPGRGLQ